MTLNDIQVGQAVEITGIGGLSTVAAGKLMDIGFVPGSIAVLIRVAPLGDPIWLKIKGFQLCIRRQSARHILVKEI